MMRCPVHRASVSLCHVPWMLVSVLAPTQYSSVTVQPIYLRPKVNIYLGMHLTSHWTSDKTNSSDAVQNAHGPKPEPQPRLGI